MPTRATQLVETFLAAIDAFNDDDFDTYEKLLHKDVVLFHMHDLDEDPIVGKAFVLKYMEEYSDEYEAIFKPIGSISFDEYGGIVSGVAVWIVKKDGDYQSIKVNYRF